MAELSKTQIDKLGERLKGDDVTEADLRLLNDYRKSFSPAYELVVGVIKKELNLAPTGRPAKSTPSITQKLRRETIRLTQIQDIAGCRIVVSDTKAQNEGVSAIGALFDEIDIIDRRRNPSHGYRAVHLVVKHERRLVEIQVRTALQHLWAEFSEKLSDQIDPALKYGGGSESWRQRLEDYSSAIADYEDIEVSIAAEKMDPDWESIISTSKLLRDKISESLKQAIATWPKKG